MKIFVTVGTTPFDSLIKQIDNIKTGHKIIFQISKYATYIPKNGTYFNFTNNILNYYKNSDLIITHAGAGSIYKLLELNKKIIIVPNTTRVDLHQMDISNYMEKNNFARVCKDIRTIGSMIDDSINVAQYTYEPFNKMESILKLISSEYKI